MLPLVLKEVYVDVDVVATPTATVSLAAATATANVQTPLPLLSLQLETNKSAVVSASRSHELISEIHIKVAIVGTSMPADVTC